MTTPAPLGNPLPAMAERIVLELEVNPLSHEWVIAAEVSVDTKTARRTALRGSYRSELGQRIDALETYCKRCRRPLDDVGDEDCAAKVDNTHLIGGNPGERAKRKIPAPQGIVGYVQVVPRRDMEYGGFTVSRPAR